MTKKVTLSQQRKADHIDISLNNDVQSSQNTGLDRISIVHEALPEINFSDIDLTTKLFGKEISYPIFISSMIGGTEYSEILNKRLAHVAQNHNLAMGVGSQRIALEEPHTTSSFSIIRSIAPRILLFANLGAVQLNKGFTIDHCQRAVDMIEADALILHLNPLQEAVQEAGDTDFSGLVKKIEHVCQKINIPIIVKEVGSGISKRTAKLLSNCGVSAIDVAGAGGTNWSKVEMHRSSDTVMRQLAASFQGWGISTITSIRNVKVATPDMTILASGGIRNGIDITKCIALGATLGGMASPFIKAAAQSTEQLNDLINLIILQIRVAMFCCGAPNLSSLDPSKLISAEYS